MSYPSSIDTDTTPGTSIYPPQAGQSPGALTSAPTGPASPTSSQWMQRVADSLIGVETQVGLPSSPAPGSVLATLATKISDAPSDGNLYGRKNAAWAAVTGGGGGPPALVASVSRIFVFGDSLGANSAWNQGQYRVTNNNASLYPEIISQALGVGWNGRYTGSAGNFIGAGTWVSGTFYTTGSIVLYAGKSWIALQGGGGVNNINQTPALGSTWWGLYQQGNWTGFTTQLGWDNYANSGAIWEGALPNVRQQILQFLTDFSNVVPTGSLIHLEWTGLNDVANLCQNYGLGMVTNSDPLGITFSTFTQPAVGSPVNVTFSATPAGMAPSTGQWVCLLNSGGLCGLYAVGANVSGNTFTLTLEGALWDTGAGIAPGNSVSGTGSSVRWAAAQLIDDILTSVVASLNNLISKGATLITATTAYDLNIAPAWSSVANGTATSRWFNTKLKAAVANMSQVFIFDLAATMNTIIASPATYGLRNIGSSTQFDPVDETLWFYSATQHPTPAGHRLIAISWLQFLLSTAVQLGNVPLSTQLAGGINRLNISGNGAPAFWTTPTWVTTLGQNTPPLLTAADPRIVLAQGIAQPHLIYRVVVDYDKNLLLEDAGWAAVTGGTGGGSIYPPGSEYTYLTRGAMMATLSAAGDHYGQIKNNTGPFVYGLGPPQDTGPLACVARITYVLNGSDQIIYRAGFIGGLQLARPTNGIFIEVTWNAGTVTAVLVLANGGSYTTASFPVTSTNNGAAQTIWFSSDTKLLKWNVYVGQNPVLLVTMPALPSGAALYLAHQFTKPIAGGGISYCLSDMICGILTNPRY